MACTSCPAGTSCDGINHPAACADGKYSTDGMSSCIDCPAGFECPDQKSKTACTASGTYSLSGELHCNTCAAGFKCASVDRVPVMCDAGYYSPPGQTTCTICPAGSMCSDASKAPQTCTAGTTSSAGATYCTGCPAGATCTGGTSTFCASGTIPNQDGSACVNCPAGVACPSAKWEKQVACPPGYYSTDGMMHCEISPAGKFAATTTAAPADAATGHFADVGMTYEVKCPPGYECKDKTGRHNRMCAPGSFYTGDGTCQSCAAAAFCPIAIGGYRSSGIACPAGTFAPAGSFDCELCKPGFGCSISGSGATTGSACNLGTYQLGGSQSC